VYAGALTLLLSVLAVGFQCLRALREASRRERSLRAIRSEWRNLPDPETFSEKEYQDAIRALGEETERLQSEFEAGQRDMADYYTAWVHQIKTPIAVMRMLLSDRDTEESRALSAELFRIEQYVEMVLTYIRLEADTSDLMIREYPLDDIIRGSIRKYASQFVGRRLYVHYGGTEVKLVTDKLWFSQILDQLLSNAVKYTPSGGVTVEVTAESVVISDTGIGIAPEDLPRIFEKGYTGANGRLGQKSSGLGLYLCKKAADRLGVPIRAESTPGKGSVFTLDIRQGE